MKKRINYASSLLLSLCFAAPLHAKAYEFFREEAPVLFYADEQEYTPELGILTLRGRVEFQHLGQLLEADVVTYNERTSLVTASGHVRLRRPQTGEVLLSEYLELSGDFKNGMIRAVRLLLEDDSKFVAQKIQKKDTLETFQNVAYTPCNVCQSKGPLWQISARKATRDTATKQVSFTDGFLEMFDVPVAYFPHMEYPYERSSGFLVPDMWYSDNGLGFYAQTPYFWAIDESTDVTLSPIFFTQHAPIGKAQVRKAFDRGLFEMEGSITAKKNAPVGSERYLAERKIPQTRGHVLVNGLADINDNWRAKVQGGYVSDRTYFRRFPFALDKTNAGFDRNDPVLVSKGTLEGFFNRDYASAIVTRYQDLRDGGKQKTMPYITPYVSYQGYSQPGRWGDRFVLDTSFLNIAREEGPLVQRNVNTLAWELPYTHPSGQVFTLFSSLRGDIYNINHNTMHPPVENGWTGRLFPQGGLDWRLPFAKVVDRQTYIISPVAQVILAPNGANPRRIIDEDSSSFEFTDTNLFSHDRVPGYDIIDSGSRLNYGFEMQTNGEILGNISGFLGQSLAFADPKRKNEIQGLGHHFSDLVGRVEVEPVDDFLAFHYRFRVDQSDMKWRFSELGGFVGPEEARLATDYIFVARDVSLPNQGKLHQIRLDFSSQFTDLWSFFVGTRRDLLSKNAGGGELSKYTGVRYKDECFMIELSLENSRFHDRDVRPGTTLMLSIEFKNLGQFSRDFGLTRQARDKDYDLIRQNGYDSSL